MEFKVEKLDNDYNYDNTFAILFILVSYILLITIMIVKIISLLF